MKKRTILWLTTVLVVTLDLSMHYGYRQNASSKLDGCRYAIQATDATFQLEVLEFDNDRENTLYDQPSKHCLLC